MAWSRRDLLRAFAGAAGAVPVLSACAGGENAPPACDPELVPPTWDGPPGPEDLFQHGVASGDPLPDGVILWTRVTPAGSGQVDVYVEVATDPGFACVVTSGSLTVGPARDHTVKIDVTGLSPATTFYYRFHAQGRVSPVGRTRTAPVGVAERLAFGVCSCSNYASGYFHNYRALAERPDLDAVLHLGDYLYEYGSGGDRAHRPAKEVVTLDEYRERHAQYKSDPDLQEAHRQHPFVAVWDDHETANNAWRGGAENHDPGEGSWRDRAAAARRAYLEWMPVREGARGRLYRRLAYGDLVDLFVVDTRIEGRDVQSPDPAVIWDEGRQLLGEAQEAWLVDGLTTSTARWKLIANQVVMCGWYLDRDEQDRPTLIPASEDNWAGYAAARRRVLSAIADGGVNGVVVLTGDVHSSWANEVPIDPADYDLDTGRGSVCVEAVCPGITSSGVGGLEEFLIRINPHIRWGNSGRRGFLVLTVEALRARADWFLSPDGAVESPTYVAPEPVAAFETAWGEPIWVSVEPRGAAADGAPALAP